MKLKLIIIFAVILFSSIMTFAVPADKKPITIKQPNGKTLTFILQGDERISWGKTLDDYSLLTNKNGNWVYAMIDEKGFMVPSDVLACNKVERSDEELEFLKNIKTNLFFSKSQIDAKLNRVVYSENEQAPKPKKKWWRWCW
ncbi:MAG: hypothetical protein PHD62_06355 [Bacteroidales bacterium]|nr:hypothetical protein [Bacteroidales bacterium]